MRHHPRLLAFLSALLALTLLAACSEKGPDAASDEKEPTPPVKEETEVPAPEWETWVYQDDSLRYELPAGWAKNETYSSDQMRLAFFTMEHPTTETPSNVNIQILNRNNQSQDFDYSDPEVQADFHDFLLGPDGLPQKEAQTGTYSAKKIQDLWVYSLSFSRDRGDGVMVQQTCYFPMGLPYSISIWATDFQDDCSPSVEEISEHICATLEIL